MMETRAERGRRALQEIDGDAGEKVVEALAGIAPDFATYLLEFAFGDIYCRPGLSTRDREIATIAALTAMGTATPQLKVHVAAGLNVGLTREEIVEVMMQMAVYAGFPAALNGCSPRKRCSRPPTPAEQAEQSYEGSCAAACAAPSGLRTSTYVRKALVERWAGRARATSQHMPLH